MNVTLQMAIRAARAARFVVPSPPPPRPKPVVIIKVAPQPPPPPPTLSERSIAQIERAVEVLKTIPSAQLADRVKDIQNLVCREYLMKRDVLLGDHRNIPAVRARDIAIIIARLETGMSYPQLGRRFPNLDRGKPRDHTSMLHSVRKMEKRIADDPDFAAEIETLRAKLREGGMAC